MGDKAEKHVPRRKKLPPRSIEEYIMQKTYLGVSEVVSPAWCEYAYLYNLLFQSHLPLSMRPLSIITPRGTILKPNWTLVEQKEQVLEQGTAVHEDIERDVLPVQVALRVETREDEWALLLLQFATGMYILHTRGRTREVPVFGIVHGKLIRGIIDELHLDAQGDIVLVETKTRSSTTIPLQRDQQPAHWQCMLYRRLLVSLAATWQCTMDDSASPLDLSVVWETFQIRPDVPLTSSFLQDVNRMTRYVDTPWESRQWSSQLTLRHVIDLLKSTLRACQRRMSPTMKIVYMKQDTAEILDNVSLANNPKDLDTFLETTFALLDGKREPEGVAICSTNRCERCIWRESCEWREDMAKAAQERARKRKGERARQSDDHQLWAEFDEKDLQDLDW